MAVGASAAAAPVDCSFSAWEGNPIAWTLDGEFGGAMSQAEVEALPLAMELICPAEENQGEA